MRDKEVPTVSVRPQAPCPNCKTSAVCVATSEWKRIRSEYKCSNCNEPRLWGVLQVTPRIIGYRFGTSESEVLYHLCWRCHDKHVDKTSYPDLSYLKGPMTTLYDENITPERPYNWDYHCDECGVLIDDQC